MNIRSLLRHPKAQSRRSRSRLRGTQQISAGQIEKLEAKTLLAGNVTAQFVGQTAVVTGDGADNSVELFVDNGSVVARGTDGTTINGSTADFVLATGSVPVNLRAFLGGGNDSFVVDGVTIGRDVWIDGGAGNDQLAVVGGSTVQRNLTVTGRTGNDVINLQDSAVFNNVRLAGHAGDDRLTVSSVQTGRNLRLEGGTGSDDFVVDESRIGLDTTVIGWSGHDDVVIRNSELVDDLRIVTHRGADVIFIDSSTVGDKSVINTGSGSDDIVIQGATRFFDRMIAVGGRAPDNFEASGEVIFDGLRRRSFSGSIANALTVESRITSPTTGAIAAAESSVAAFGDELVLSVDNNIVSEGAGSGAAVLTVTRNGDLSNSLEVAISSSNEARLTVEQMTVTIPVGQSSVSVFLNAVDNSTVNDNTTVTLIAAAAGFEDVMLDVDITDNDGDTLLVSANPSELIEDSGNPLTVGAATGVLVTVTRNGDTTSELVVDLSRSLETELELPSTVTIPAGENSVTVSGQTIPDGVSEPDQSVVVTASASGFQSGVTSITIIDNDAARLSVETSTPIVTESGSDSTAQVTVTRNTDNTADLLVTLSVDQPDSLSVPMEVTIPAGSDFATFEVTAIDDTVVDGDVIAIITASASGLNAGSAPLVTQDDDDPTLAISFPNGNSVEEGAGDSALTITVSRNTIDTSEAIDLLVALAGDDRLSGPTSVTIPSGAMTVDFTLDAGDNDLVDQPEDGTVSVTVSAAGFVGSTADAVVTNDDVATLMLSPVAFSVLEDGGMASLSLSRNDAGSAETISLSYSNTNLLTGPSTVEFQDGESTISIPLTIIDNPLFTANESVTVTADSDSHAAVFSTINIVNDEVLSLSTDVSANNALESNGTLVTNAETFVITGVTAAGATVQADADGDGQFDEASVVAENDGSYEIVIPLVHDTTNRGANPIQLQAVSFDGVITPSAIINVHRSVGTVVRFETNQDFDTDGNLDFVDVELLDTDAPGTVANFLSYTNAVATGTERFDNLLLQRSDDNFIVQAGRFNKSGDAITEIDRDADNDGAIDTIPNEFDAANSNLRGTLSMALPAGQPDGGSSEWFINTADNVFLDDPARLHTVFGRVIGDGMDVIDAANQLPVFDLNDVFGSGALGEVPLAENPFNQISGTVALSENSAIITGTGTSFTTDLSVGDFISISGSVVQVQAIASDTELTIDVEANTNVADLSVERYDMPGEDAFVVFTNIEEILDNV